jgi:methylamine dehydrogenase heavy chain
MSSVPIRTAAALCLLCSASLYAAPAAPPPLPPEHLTVQRLPPRSPHWVYVFDNAFANEIDSRVHLFDADSYRRLGQIDAGFVPSVTLSPDGGTTAVATTYYARGSRGARTDVVEFTDNSTLAVTHEIVLPSKRAMTAPTLYNVTYSSDAHFVYVTYLTPAASFGVLDPAAGKVLSEIDTAGCVLSIPVGPNRVSSLCENGRLLTVSLDASGHESGRAMTDPFFDADKDPVFAQGIPAAKGVTFLSFLGEVHDVDLSGDKPVFAPPWSLLSGAEKGQWRPGADQVGAIHKDTGRLYVPMHKGGEGTHKDGGTEIWVFDLGTHRRLARWPLQAAGLVPALALQVSQDRAPLLYVANAAGDLGVFDALDGKLRHVEHHIGSTLWMLLTP